MLVVQISLSGVGGGGSEEHAGGSAYCYLLSKGEGLARLALLGGYSLGHALCLFVDCAIEDGVFSIDSHNYCAC